MLKKIFYNILKFLLFLGIGLTILYLVYQKQEAAYQEECLLKNIPAADCNLIQKNIDDFKTTNFFWIFIVLIAFTISNISRALRWNMLLKPMGYVPRLYNSFLTIIIGYFANLGLPRIGEVVRGATLSKYEHIPVEKAMGTIVVGRMVDVLCLLTAFGLVLIFQYEDLWNYLSGALGEKESKSGLLSNPWVQGVLGLMILGSLFMFIYRKKIKQTAFFQRVKKILLGFAEGLQTIMKLEKPWLFVLHSINIWVMYFLMTYLCFFAFEPTAHLGPMAGLVVFVFGALGIVVPSPGGLGTYQLLAIEALSIYHIPNGDATSFANILFVSVQLGCNVILGILSLLLLPILNRNYKPNHSVINKANTSTSD